MGQHDAAKNLTQGQITALVNKLGGEDAVKRILCSRRILRLVLEDDRLRYLGDIKFPAMPELFVGDLPISRIASSYLCSSAMERVERSRPIPATPEIRLMRFEVIQRVTFSELREMLVPNHVYPEEMEILRARIIWNINRRQPYGQVDGGFFKVGKSSEGRIFRNHIPVEVEDGYHMVELLYSEHAGPETSPRMWQLYSLSESEACDYVDEKVEPGDVVYVAEASQEPV